jgi:hypothetical protein
MKILYFVNITYFGYNHLMNTALVIEYLPDQIDTEIYHVITFDEWFLTTTEYREYGRSNVTEEDRTVKAMLTSRFVLFTLTASRVVKIYLLASRLELMQELTYDDIINFDVFDNEFFVLYRGTNTVEIYQINDVVRLEYVLKLPLYRQFEDFKFVPYEDKPNM